MEKKNNKRLVWTPAADETFIDLWEEKADDLRGYRKNSHIYAEMAQSLAACVGGIRSLDVKYKIHNFTMKYNKCKQKQGTGCSPSAWKHFERVHRIIGGNRINIVEVVVQDSIRAMPKSTTSQSCSSPISALCTPTATVPHSIASPIKQPCSSLPSASSIPTSQPSSPASSESSTPGKNTKNHKTNELNETIKTAMAENNKLTADLIEIEKKKVAAIEMLSQSVISFLERN